MNYIDLNGEMVTPKTETMAYTQTNNRIGTLEEKHETDMTNTRQRISETASEIGCQINNEINTVNSRITSEISTVNNRFDNIIAHNNDTDGNSELIDMRVGTDGTVYTSAGEALRTQMDAIKNNLSDIAAVPDTTNYIDLSAENMIVVDTNFVPAVSVTGNKVTITQPSRANVKVAFPITVNNTDINTVYRISVESSITLTELASVRINVGTSEGTEGTTVNPVLSTENYKTWSVSGAFANTQQKYLYIMLPYTVATSTFTINIRKDNSNARTYIKPEAISNLTESNLDTRLRNKISRIGEDNSGKTLVILNFEQNCDDFYQDRQALLESYGFKGSFAFNENTFDQTTMVSRLHDLVNKGHDIALYSGSTAGRPNDPDDTTRQAEWDAYVDVVVDSAKKYGIRNPTAYHCKYNQMGQALYNSLVSRGFKVARCANCTQFGLDGTNYIKSFDKTMTVVNTAGLSSTATSGGYIYWIHQAIQNGWDLSIFGHGMEDVDENTSTSDPVKFKKYVLVEILDHLQQCVENGTVAVVTWEEYCKIRSGT